MEKTRSELRRMSAAIDTLMDLGRTEEAQRLLTEALEGSAHDRPYHLFFQAEAAAYLREDYRGRERLLAQGLKEAPDEAFLLRNLGGGYLLEKKLSKARRLFREALQAEPRDADTLRCLGLLCSMRGKESRAMEWYRQALAAKPDDHDSMRQMGVSCSKLGNDREALEWYRQAVECCSEDYDAMRQMGISCAMLGDYETALTWLHRALEVHPGDVESKRNIRLVKRKQKDDDTVLGALVTRLVRRSTLAWRRFVDRLFSPSCEVPAPAVDHDSPR